MKRELEISVEDRKYLIHYPNVGQVIDMTTRENFLCKGSPRDLMFSGLPEHQEVYLSIRVIVFYETMVPQLIKDLKVNSLMDLDPIDFSKLSDVYFNEVYPWLNEWKKEIQELGKKK